MSYPPEIVELYNQLMISCHSTALEGSTLSFNDTIDLLDNGMITRPLPIHDVMMVKDHHEALQFVLGLARNQVPLTIALLQKINSLVLKNTGKSGENIFGKYDSSQGDIRTVSVTAGSRLFMDAKKVPIYLAKLIEELSPQNLNTLEGEEAIRTFGILVHSNFSKA